MVARVFAVNICLALLALITVIEGSLVTDIAAFVLGAALVTWLLSSFTRRRD